MAIPGELVFLEYLAVIFMGVVFGSFASALIYRIPRDLPWFYYKKGGQTQACRSACPHCNHTLAVRDLIPVLSWAMLRGKCRHCHAKISIMYPLAELTCVAGFLAVYSGFGLAWPFLALYLLVPVLVALIFIDAEHYILPDELVMGVGLLGLLHWGLYWMMSFVNAGHVFDFVVIGGAGFGLFAWILGIVVGKVLKKEVLGFGDVKLFAAIGMWLGLAKLSYFAILSGALGIVFGLAWRLAGKGAAFPFGPALILAFFVLLFI